MQVLQTTSSIRRLLTSLDIHYNISYKLMCRNKMSLNKETSNKICQLKDFPDSMQQFFSINIKFYSFFSKSELWEVLMVQTSTTLTGLILFYLSEFFLTKNLVQIKVIITSSNWICSTPRIRSNTAANIQLVVISFSFHIASN